MTLKLVQLQKSELSTEQINKVADTVAYEDRLENLGLEFPKFKQIEIFNADGELINGHKAIANEQTGDINAIMSDRYKIFNHEEAFKIIDNAATGLAGNLASPKVNFYSNGGAMKVTYDLPTEYDITVAEGDDLKTRLVAYNSVDGSRTLGFDIEFLRLICANGMMGFTKEFSFTRKHSRFIHEDTEQINIAAQIKKAYEVVLENASLLKNNAVDYKRGMDAIKAMVDRKLFPKKMQYWIESEWRKSSNDLHNGGSAENGANLWSLYNAFTNAITHSVDTNGNSLSDQQKELYGKRINNMIMKLVA